MLKFREDKNSKGRWVRDCRYEGISLKEALQFSDHKWCSEFFHSIENMHEKHPGKMLLLEWTVHKKDLSKNVVEWRVIANRGGYDPSKISKSEFGRVIPEDYTPVVHDTTGYYSGRMHSGPKSQDLVMISPGKGNGTGYEGKLHGLGEGRCIHLTNFMCLEGTSFEEKKDLWKMVGKTALRRIQGDLRRYTGYYGRDGHHRGEVASVDQDGHDTMTISTHGFGVAWLHVRVESNPQYKDQANH